MNKNLITQKTYVLECYNGCVKFIKTVLAYTPREAVSSLCQLGYTKVKLI